MGTLWLSRAVHAAHLETRMIKALLLMFLPALCMGAGPKYSHDNAKMDDEVDQIYYDLSFPNIVYGKASTMTVTYISGSTATFTGHVVWPKGMVIQSTWTTSAISILNVSGQTYQNTGSSATITPLYATSKIRVRFIHSFTADAGSQAGEVSPKVQVVRDSTSIREYFGGCGIAANGGTLKTECAMVGETEDYPATTSAVTYKTQFANYQGLGLMSLTDNLHPASMVLEEISGP